MKVEGGNVALALADTRRRMHAKIGPMLALVVGGGGTTAAILGLHQGASRTYAVALGFAIVVLGCITGLVSSRRTTAAHREEVASLRNELYVAELDREADQRRIEDLERELSCHSRALARLLNG